MCTANQETTVQEQVNVATHFPCPVYIIDRPDFLNVVQGVSEEHLKLVHAQREVNDIYPAMMTNSFHNDERIRSFGEYVASTAWNILDNQGYAMQHFNTFFESMWTQEHHKQSSMEQHVHGGGVQIVGFYFLEVPENSSRVVFHDPRPGKIMGDLPQKDISQATPASQMINFEAKPGRLIFSNAWLPHSFTRHAGETPLKFVHFNIGVMYADQQNQTCQVPPAAEVV
jgi:Putative 2OG-Fe(II) oxygenase